jgi:hypothetical protein
MRGLSTLGEAGRNVRSGESYPRVSACAFLTVAMATFLFDLSGVANLQKEMEIAFGGLGSTYLVVGTAGSMDGQTCASLNEASGVVSAGPLRQRPDWSITSPPGVPTILVEGSYDAIRVLTEPSGEIGAVAIEDELTGLVSVPGAVIVNDSAVEVTRVFEGASFLEGSVLSETLLIGDFDACVAKIWPFDQAVVDNVLNLPIALGDDTASVLRMDETVPEVDGLRALTNRSSRNLWILGSLLMALLQAALVRARRLDFASQMNVGVRRQTLCVMVIYECLATLVPCGLTALTAMAICLRSYELSAAARAELTQFGLMSVVAGLLACMLASLLGAVTVRERSLLRYFQDR